MPRSLDELIARADEFADMFEKGEGFVEVTEPESPERELQRMAYRRLLAERDLAMTVVRARTAGVAWATIGAAVGTSGEAARQRYAAAVDAA